MYKCEYCDKEVKSKSGLKRHQSTCKEKDVIKDTSDELESKVIVNEGKSKLDKIKSAYRSTYDAKSRYDLEQEYISVGGKPEELRR